MPVIKSAIKKLKQSQKRTQANKVAKREIKEAIDAFRHSPSAKLYAQVSSLVDKANKSNLLHPNKSARLKSRLSKLLKK